ncbi:MAG: cytochrome P450 [Burkholderiales bacterium]
MNRGFWRKLRIFPSIAATLIAAFTAYFVLIAGLALWFPGALRAVSILAIFVLIFAWWRARPGYGRSRGLPPGSLALAPLAPWVDDLYYQKQSARYGPIFKVSNFTQPMVCIVGFERAREALRSHDRFLEIPPLPFSRFIPGGFLRYMQPADHRTYGALFRSAFDSAVIEACEPFIADAIRDELFRMSECSARTPTVGVQPEPYLDRMLFAILARVFYGVLPETAAFTRLQSLYRVLDYRRGWRTSRRKVLQALDETTTILHEQTTQWSQLDRRGDKAPDCFLRQMIQTDPETARNRTALWNLIYILQTSWRDLAGLLQWNLKMLSDHPIWVDRLRESMASHGQQPDCAPDGLATRVVMETLRLEQSDYLMRQTTRELAIDGFVIPKRWLLRICVRESHRSSEAFAGAERFDPDRFLAPNHKKLSYAPFGASRIRCPGEHLSLSVGRIFVREMTRGFDWEVTRDGRVEYGGFHWKPSSKFRVRMTRR